MQFVDFMMAIDHIRPVLVGGACNRINSTMPSKIEIQVPRNKYSTPYEGYRSLALEEVELLTGIIGVRGKTAFSSRFTLQLGSRNVEVTIVEDNYEDAVEREIALSKGREDPGKGRSYRTAKAKAKREITAWGTTMYVCQLDKE